MSTSSRSCGRGSNCASATIGAHGQTVPRWGPAAFCARDTQLIDGALRALPGLYVELWIELRHRRRAGDTTPVSGSREPPTPLNLHADALMREIQGAVLTWEEVCVAAVTPAQEPPGGTTLRSLHRACGWLSAHLGTLLALERAPQYRRGHLEDLGGVEAGLELLQLHRLAQRMIGVTQRAEAQPAPCPSCMTYGLVRDDDLVRCEVCGRVLNAVQYDEWVELLLSGHRG